MSKKKRSLLDQTGPFSSWKENSERLQQLISEWLETQTDSATQVQGNLHLSANLARLMIRVNKSAEFEKSQSR